MVGVAFGQLQGPTSPADGTDADVDRSTADPVNGLNTQVAKDARALLLSFLSPRLDRLAALRHGWIKLFGKILIHPKPQALTVELCTRKMSLVHSFGLYIRICWTLARRLHQQTSMILLHRPVLGAR
jgi:hypothetical protein